MRQKTITVQGLSETERLVEYVNQIGLKRAAEKYGTNASSLSRWLRTQGYHLHRVYVLTPRGKELVNASE